MMAGDAHPSTLAPRWPKSSLTPTPRPLMHRRRRGHRGPCRATCPGGRSSVAPRADSRPEGRCNGTTDDELIGVLRAWQRQESWSAARRLAVTAELIRRRPAPGCRPGEGAPGAMPSGWEKFCADELAAATACSGHAAEKTLILAHDLAARLPQTARALHEGIIDL